MLINLSKIFKKQYKTLNLIEISRENLINNYKFLSSLNKNIKIAPVIKSNGYGHGILNVAKILDPLHPPFLCVDSLFEAYQLQKANIKTPILITSYTNPENLKIKKLPFSFAVYTSDLLEVIAKYQPHCGIHIFVDTGMRREGVTIKQLPNFLETAKKLGVRIDGLLSHLASSNGRSDKLFLKQIEEFKKALAIINKFKLHPRWIHIGATGSMVNPETRPIISEFSNMVRAGLALYGFSSSTHTAELTPTLKLITHIAQVKILRKGETTGYDGTYSAKKDTIIGILPIGYYDGVDRGLSNKGFVKIKDIYCPIIGRVSINLTITDITNATNVKVGDEVIVYSDNSKDKNSIENTAKICKKIPYEIFVNLAESTRRVIV